MFPHGETVTFLTAAVTDDGYGGELLDWSDPVEDVRHGCAVAPRNDRETPGDARSAIVTGFQILAPAGLPVDPHARVVVRGETHEVDGMPALWRSPFSGWAPGVEVLTRRVEG